MDANKTCPCGAWRPRDDEWLSAMPLLTEERKNHAVTRQISEARLHMVRELKDECERLRHENKEQYEMLQGYHGLIEMWAKQEREVQR